MNIFAGELNNPILTMAAKVFFDYISYMETYRGRDKFIRATSYLACLVSGKLQAKAEFGKCFIVEDCATAI